MKKSNSIRIKVRRRKVAHLAAYSRKYTVSNCTIQKAKPENIIDIEYKWGIVKGTKGGEWKDPKDGYPQPKPMTKRGIKLVYNKETHKTVRICTMSTFTTKKHESIQKMLWKNLGKAAKMEAYVQHKLKRWERKHPKPCLDDDLFKEEYIPLWESERENALERIRDFVVSVFDKLPIVGNRINYTTGELTEQTVGEIKDIDGKGHDVNYPNLKETDKLYIEATKIAQNAMNKDSSIVDCNLKNHKRNQKRPLFHAKRSKAKIKTLQEHKQMKKAA